MTLLEPAFPLADLKWAGHRVSAIAALMVLMCLAVRLNMSRRDLEHDQGNSVRLTYTEMEDLTGYARPTISKAITLLEALHVMHVAKSGRINVYELSGVGERGGWCQLPQGYLLDGSPDGKLKRLSKIHNNRLTLEALKLYILLLTFRNQQLNTTAISYEAIIKYTGMRREDIPKAGAISSR